MRVLGIDPSLTGTGLCVLDGRGRIVDHSTIDGRKLRGAERLDVIEAVVGNWLRHLNPGDVVVIESPSYGSRTGNGHELAGLWWIVRRAVERRRRLLGGELTILTAAPTSRAKYATGSGKADKKMVMAAARNLYPQAGDWDDNAIDALVLAHMGLVRAGAPLVRYFPGLESSLAMKEHVA